MDMSSVIKVKILSQVLPLDIKLDRNIIMDFLNILRKPNGYCLKVLIVKQMSQDNISSNIITPVQKYKMACQYRLDFDITELRNHTQKTWKIFFTYPINLGLAFC
jgi:hypothetical protein